MLKNILAYTILWFIFRLVTEINCQPVPFKPEERLWHTATLINGKLYILGGYPIESVGKDFFYLDVSVPFNTQNLLWQDLSSVNTVPSHSDAASADGGADKNTLFLYGGNGEHTAMKLVYTFNPQNNSWNIPKTTGIETTRKLLLTGIIDDSGKMYLWGGENGELVSQNDMLILDTINLSFGEGSSVGAPTPRTSYGATLLPNQKIIYIGE
jgi:N-acetylneuraminic acid mutarotase